MDLSDGEKFQIRSYDKGQEDLSAMKEEEQEGTKVRSREEKRIGDITLLSLETTSKAGSCRLGAVVEVELDKDGLAHTLRDNTPR